MQKSLDVEFLDAQCLSFLCKFDFGPSLRIGSSSLFESSVDEIVDLCIRSSSLLTPPFMESSILRCPSSIYELTTQATGESAGTPCSSEGVLQEESSMILCLELDGRERVDWGSRRGCASVWRFLWAICFFIRENLFKKAECRDGDDACGGQRRNPK